MQSEIHLRHKITVCNRKNNILINLQSETYITTNSFSQEFEEIYYFCKVINIHKRSRSEVFNNTLYTFRRNMFLI